MRIAILLLSGRRPARIVKKLIQKRQRFVRWSTIVLTCFLVQNNTLACLFAKCFDGNVLACLVRFYGGIETIFMRSQRPDYYSDISNNRIGTAIYFHIKILPIRSY